QGNPRSHGPGAGECAEIPRGCHCAQGDHSAQQTGQHSRQLSPGFCGGFMYKLIASLLIASLLCACGWHLRGSTPVSNSLKSIYLSSEDNYSPVRLELEQLMAIHGITLAASPAESDLQLHIEEEI